jgi:hypothetical protein
LHEIIHRSLDDFRLIRGEVRFGADGEIRPDLGHRPFDVLAERQHVSAGPHRDADPDRRLAIDAKHRLRRIGVGTFDFRDIGQSEEFDHHFPRTIMTTVQEAVRLLSKDSASK